MHNGLQVLILGASDSVLSIRNSKTSIWHVQLHLKGITTFNLIMLLLCHWTDFGLVNMLSFQYVSTCECHMMVQHCGCLLTYI